VKPANLPAPDGRGRIMMAGPTGGPGSKDPGRVRYPYISLKNLLMDAYDVKSLQIQGPAWLDTQRFDLNAHAAGNYQGAIPLDASEFACGTLQIDHPSGN